jgi:hypothetical protein
MASSPAQSGKLVYRSLPSSVAVQRDSLQSRRPRAVATCFICNCSYGSAPLHGGTKSGLPLCHVWLLMPSTTILWCHLPADSTASGSGKHHEKPSCFIPAFNKCGKWHLSNLFSRKVAPSMYNVPIWLTYVSNEGIQVLPCSSWIEKSTLFMLHKLSAPVLSLSGNFCAHEGELKCSLQTW